MIIGKHKYNQLPPDDGTEATSRMRAGLPPLQHSEGPGEPPFRDNYEPARVRYGVMNRVITAYMTVGEFRATYARAWRLPPDAEAYSGRFHLEDEYLIQPGDVIEFHRRMGR